jgi:hypothetical protein
MFNNIFDDLGGLYASQSLNPQALQNSIGQGLGLSQSMMNQTLAQQQMQAYKYAQQQRTARWMINGQVFKNAEEFAEYIWPDDEQARLMFVLKFGGD